ncbi:hypothetical protein B0F90DRAFT_1622992 [Multifurca ochricompacta]|uniref:Uncharacterized protein n=1 Tax=Multifurca ochricompacta TaxID=376703 RepID=A0AAD4MAF6_9AGAM|nr:hypothetical protein B0F90DRAFT_1622992 [Multifurca ochricompacta]
MRLRHRQWHHATLTPQSCSWRASSHTISGVEALDRWISQKKSITLSETLHTDRVSDLYVTLPTRDGTRRPYASPKNLDSLGFGHHLTFFHPRTPEIFLRPDGTDADFCPPEPFVQRMWAGGRIEWRKPLVIGEKATAHMSVRSVDKKGFSGPVPMVFVKQGIEITNEGEEDSAILEERTHVYLALGTKQNRFREVHGLPPPDFSFKFTPSPITLFRFSALTFNGHHIHLDPNYARGSDGYPERLVHGPLMALMLLETLTYNHPDAQLKSFEYRALNPVVVNSNLTFYGTWSGRQEIILWVQDEAGVVGMRGKAFL